MRFRQAVFAAPARSTRTAVRGSATDEIWSPNIDTADTPQYRRKTRSCSNGGTIKLGDNPAARLASVHRP
jgi:hypothetical protein